jgi:predicted nucleotidyltransferase
MNEALTKEQIITILKAKMPYLREKYGVEKIAIYGSFAKGKPRKRSDVDLLVGLSKPLGLEFVTLAYDLEEALGRKVDLATLDTLARSLEDPRYRHIAEDIQQTLLYV